MPQIDSYPPMDGLTGAETFVGTQGGLTKIGSAAQIAAYAALSAFNVNSYGAKGDTIKLTATTSISSGDAVLQVTGAQFTADDVGKTIAVVGAGAVASTLWSTIASVQGTTEVTLADVAGRTLAAVSAVIFYGTNDTVAIANALTAAGVAGGFVTFPAGYYLSGSLSVPSNVTLQGAGKDCTFLVPDNTVALGPGAASWFITNADFSSATQTRLAHDIGVYDMGFDGASLAYPLWLQDPVTGDAVTDPQNDYTANGGPIGDAAYAAVVNSIAQAQAFAGAGAFTINGVGGSGVTVGGGTATLDPIRRVTITQSAGNTGRNVTIVGTLNGHAKTVTIPLLAGAGTSGVDSYDQAMSDYTYAASGSAGALTGYTFSTVTSASVDGAITGTLSLGNADFDITALVNQHARRNPLAGPTLGVLMYWRKVNRVNVVRCGFYNYGGITLATAGCQDEFVGANTFDSCGRPCAAAYAYNLGSYLNAISAPAGFTDCVNPTVIDNTFRNLQRCAIVGGPTIGGGKISRNYIDGAREAAIYLTNNFMYNGGGVCVLEDNVISNVTISDIVGKGVDASLALHFRLQNTVMNTIDNEGVDLTGATDGVDQGGYRLNCGAATSATLPYGNYGERWDLLRGTAPIAGTAPNASRLCYWKIGTVPSSTLLASNIVISGQTVKDTAGMATAIFEPVGSGNLSTDHTISALNVLDASAISFWDPASAGGAFVGDMPVSIRHCLGHESENPHWVQWQPIAGFSGTYTVTCGFRPSQVYVYAMDSATTMRWWIGEFHWKRASPYDNSFGQRFGTDFTNTRLAQTQNRPVQLVSGGNVEVFAATFSGWTEQGFTVAVAGGYNAVSVLFLCIP